MKRARTVEPKPFRRTLRARPFYWLQAWFWQFFFMALGVSLLELIFRNPGSIQKNVFLAVFMATSNLLSAIHLEWKTQPRQLHYWSEDKPQGIVIRHFRTGEILVHLPGTVLQPDDLRGLSLEGADLRAERLRGFNLRDARLRGANLSDAVLNDCNLENADLVGCRMVGVSLRGARLRGADLRGADFRGSGAERVLTPGRLEGADFFGALYNAATRWPRGFDPAAHGCAYENDAEQALPIPASSDNSDTRNLPVANSHPNHLGSTETTLQVGRRP